MKDFIMVENHDGGYFDGQVMLNLRTVAMIGSKPYLNSSDCRNNCYPIGTIGGPTLFVSKEDLDRILAALERL